MLLPGMRQDAHGPGKYEQTAAQRRRKSEFTVDHCSSAIDIQAHGATSTVLKHMLHGPRGTGYPSVHRSGCDGTVDQLEHPWRARIARVKPMPEPRHVSLPGLISSLQDGRCCCRPAVLAPTGLIADFQKKLQRLLARTTMDIAQHVCAGRHRIIEADTAGDGHSCRRDRGSLRTVIDCSNQCGTQQIRLSVIGQFTAQHQPDHRREADTAHQLLYRVAGKSDLVGTHIDDPRLPPGFRLLPNTP